MIRSKLRSLLFVAVLAVSTAPLAAQSAAQAQQMLQNNPALLQQLRQRIMTSGLTPEQVRARLRAEGYPDNLLDAYLPGSSATAADTGTPTPQVFSAITALGISDSADVAMLRCGVDAAPVTIPDTLPNGTIDTTFNRSRAEEARRRMRAPCVAQDDSIIRG